MESLEEQIKRFLSSGYGYGSGYGSGSGYGDGYGYGSGYGYGYGYGYGDGSGYGSGDGSGDGSGYGYGSGSGSGYGDGYGSGYGDGDGSGSGSGDGYGDGDGYGYGSGSGIKSYNGQTIYGIDCIPTLLYSVFGNYARGAILREDLTLQPCYVAKVGNFFAHGKTLKDARRDAEVKWNENRPIEDRIDEFVKLHPELDVPYSDLFVWHNILTGSCEMGRKEWCEEHGLKPTDSISVREFIEGTKNDYGGEVIRQLAKEYNIC